MQGEIHWAGAATDGTDETAVYRLYDSNDRLLYVGIGRNPVARWGHHSARPWWADVVRFTVVWHPTRKQAASEERVALKAESPVHNVQGTVRGGEVTGAGVRRALAGRRNFSEPLPAPLGPSHPTARRATP